MAVVNLANNILGGLSSDTKPTNYANNTLFYEFDSGSIYLWNGSSWIIKSAGSGGTTIYNIPNQDGVAELVAQWTIDDDANSFYKLANATTTDDIFVPYLQVRQLTSASFEAFKCEVEILDAHDTGTVPVYRINVRTSDADPVTTRPLVRVEDDGSAVVSVTADGLDLHANDITNVLNLKIWNPTETFKTTIVNAAQTGDFNLTIPVLNTNDEIMTSTSTSAQIVNAQKEFTSTGSIAVTFRDNVATFKNPGGTARYRTRTSAIAGNVDITLPLLTGNDTFVFQSHPQTISSKTVGDFIKFIKQGSAPSDPALEDCEIYWKAIDSNNNGLFIKGKKNGVIIEGQLW